MSTTFQQLVMQPFEHLKRLLLSCLCLFEATSSSV